MNGPIENILTALQLHPCTAMSVFLSSAAEWQLYLIGPSNLLLYQCALVCICVCTCTTETICSQWASMSHRPDQSHGIWGMALSLLPAPASLGSPFFFHILCSRSSLFHILCSSASLCSFWLIEFTFITASPFRSSPLGGLLSSLIPLADFLLYFIIT